MPNPADDAPRPQAGGVPAGGRAIAALDGALLRLACTDASSLLQRHVAVLNALNVFPVPDGDTGTNMHLTFRAAIDELEDLPEGGAGDVAQALARGAFMGAKGNSGVILSQILRGIASALAGRDEADGPAIAAALLAGARDAQKALSEPKEGTILTVVRDAASAVANDTPSSADEALARAVEAAKASVERTPELLPVLKEAGVVDAGGLGFAVILEGVLRSLRGEPLDVDLAPEVAVQAEWRSEAATFHDAHEGETGYCTEFVVSGATLGADQARTHLATLGTSLLVVGDHDLLRVHVHTTVPDDALAYGRTLGDISRVKVDNMEAQIQRFVEAEMPPAPVATTLGVVAVAAGAGIEAVFRSVGVRLVKGGQTMNPSAGEILAAIDACSQDEVAVLPNNKNIIAAAQQAADSASKRVVVVPSRSIPQGVAAVLALKSDVPFEANVAEMERALTLVRSAEVTRAVRATTLEGRRIEVGQAIGIVDGSLRVVAPDVPSAVRECIDLMLAPDAGLLTLYAGEDVREPDALALAAELRSQYDGLELELVRGGQPHYPYILSLE